MAGRRFGVGLAVAVLVGGGLWLASRPKTPPPTDEGAIPPMLDRQAEAEHFESVDPGATRDLHPAAGDADVARLVAGNTAFGLALYRKTAALQPDRNVLLSPYGAAVALAMSADLLPAEDVHAAIREVAQFGLPDEAVGPAANRLDLQLAKSSSPQASWLACQSVWSRRTAPLEPHAAKRLATQFGAAAFTFDPAHADAVAAGANRWIGEVTRGLIQDVARPDHFDELVPFVLLTANHFDGRWAIPFETKDTQVKPFHAREGRTVDAPQMRRLTWAPYAENAAYQAVSLAYEGDKFELWVILPRGDLNAAFRQRLTPELLGSLSEKLVAQTVVVALPRWSASFTQELEPALRQLGMGAAFDGWRADRDPMPTPPERIGSIVQKTVIEVDEVGTEAASATVVEAAPAGAASPEQPPPPEIICDRPFVYLLRHTATGTVLFVGEVADPTAG